MDRTQQSSDTGTCRSPIPRTIRRSSLIQPVGMGGRKSGRRAPRRGSGSTCRCNGAERKIVPYVLGEAAYWEQDLNGDELTRILGQAGIRGSIPFVRLNPDVQNTLFNLNGIAHKIVLESEFLFAESDADMADLPLYDPLDDDAVEAFRRRFYVTTFDGLPGGQIPLRFDERYYALRSAFQSFVTASSAEIADDLTLLRLAARQRWQTKRGMPGQQRVVDWITLDVEGFVYPKPDRDNFGQDLGLLSYDFRWHLGDRFTVLVGRSGGFFQRRAANHFPVGHGHATRPRPLPGWHSQHRGSDQQQHSVRFDQSTTEPEMARELRQLDRFWRHGKYRTAGADRPYRRVLSGRARVQLRPQP